MGSVAKVKGVGQLVHDRAKVGAIAGPPGTSVGKRGARLHTNNHIYKDK